MNGKRRAPREKAGGEYIELRRAFYDVWPLHRGLMTRFPAPLLEIAATSVADPAGTRRLSTSSRRASRRPTPPLAHAT